MEHLEEFCLQIEVIVSEPDLDTAIERLREILSDMIQNENYGSVLEVRGDVIKHNVDTFENVN